MKNWAATLTGQMVGRTPWSARDALVPLQGLRYQHHAERQQADGGVGRGPGGPPHHSLRVVIRAMKRGAETLYNGIAYRCPLFSMCRAGGFISTQRKVKEERYTFDESHGLRRCFLKC